MAIKTKSERGPGGTLTVDDLTRDIERGYKLELVE